MPDDEKCVNKVFPDTDLVHEKTTTGPKPWGKSAAKEVPRKMLVSSETELVNEEITTGPQNQGKTVPEKVPKKMLQCHQRLNWSMKILLKVHKPEERLFPKKVPKKMLQCCQRQN